MNAITLSVGSGFSGLGSWLFLLRRHVVRTKAMIVALLALGAAAVGARAAEVPSPAVPEVDHYVYLSFLPEPSELMQDAKANGLVIERLDKLADRVIVTYKYPDGHVATLGYALLSSQGSDRVRERAIETVETPTVVERRVVREPEVVYVERSYDPYYRTRVVYTDPWDNFWAPLTLGLGIGYISGHSWHGGHYHGGHGGWHRR